MAIHVGTSGWSYPHWNGVLYPPGTSSAGRLEIYTRRFDTVELNASFYHWPRESGFASWRRRLPAGFQLSVKAPRGLTHGRRLREPEAWLDRISSCWHVLGERRGILLVQLAPSDERDDARLDYFLSRVPPWLRVAMEFRHPSWHDEQVFSLLERHGVAYCVMSGAALPCVLRATADFVYVRLHGPDSTALYAGSYPAEDLRWWADRIHEWATSGKDVYAYFNNDGYGHAVQNADTLHMILGT